MSISSTSLKVDDGTRMTNGVLAPILQVLADVDGFGVVRPEMREFVSQV